MVFVDFFVVDIIVFVVFVIVVVVVVVMMFFFVDEFKGSSRGSAGVSSYLV